MKQKKYSEEFKRKIVGLYQLGHSQYSLMREFGLTKCRIVAWRKKYPNPIELTSDGELSELEIQNMVLQERIRILEKENQVLKDATQWVQKKK
jgi:transposase